MSPSVPLHRTALLTLGCCLLAVLATGVALGTLPGSPDAPVPEVVADGNTSNYLELPAGEAAREGSQVHGVDVGVAVAADAEAMAGRYDRAKLDYRIDNANNTQARLARVRAAVDNLSVRATRLREASRNLRESYRSGSISEGLFFARVARIEAAADRETATREGIRVRLEQMGARSQPVYLGVQALQPDVETLSGPASNMLLNRFAGSPNSTAGSSFVRTASGGGYVMSTVEGSRLYREAQIGTDWDRDAVDQFASDEEVGAFNRARSRAAELYPWAINHQVEVSSSGFSTTSKLYKVFVAHQHGDLSIYLDGTTTDVFREHQTKHLENTPWDWRQSAVNDGLHLNVSGTNPTGALEVEVTRESTGVGVDSDVQIGGTYVGATNVDGRLRTVQPSSSFTVNATADGQSVSLTVPEESQ